MATQENEVLAAPTITVTVRYFARLRESLGVSSERVELAAQGADAGALRDMLCSRGGAWAEALASGRAVRVAVNREMAESASPLRDGDEVGFLPPVTGG